MSTTAVKAETMITAVVMTASHYSVKERTLNVHATVLTAIFRLSIVTGMMVPKDL